MAWTEQLPSGRHRGVYRLPDGRKRSAGTFKTKKNALNEAAKREGEASEPLWRDPRGSTRTWGQWRDEWWPMRDVENSTLHREATMRTKHIDPRWSDVELADISRHDVRAWAVGLTRNGDSSVSMASARRIANILSASLSAAVDAGILDVNPVSRLKLGKVEVNNNRYLTLDEAERLIGEFPAGIDRTIVRALLGAGLRWGELAGLQVRRVDLQRQQIRVSEVWDSPARKLKMYPKGRRVRVVPIPKWLGTELARAIGGRRDGFVFQKDSHMIDYSNWRKKFWLPAIQSAKVAPLRIHDLRHTYASWLIQQGFSLAEVGKLLGHESPSTTQIYAHLLDEVDTTRLAAALPPIKPKK